MSEETTGAALLACYSSGGRWSPNEDRPAHATVDGKRSLCGLTNIEAFREAELRRFSQHRTFRCERCERSAAKATP